MSEILADAGIAHTVCVATEYGEIVMREQTESTKAMQTAGQPIVNLHCGRMDREQMQKFLHDEGYEIVVDATHPYARVVTENLRGAVDTLKSLEKMHIFPFTCVWNGKSTGLQKQMALLQMPNILKTMQIVRKLWRIQRAIFC